MYEQLEICYAFLQQVSATRPRRGYLDEQDSDNIKLIVCEHPCIHERMGALALRIAENVLFVYMTF